MDHIQPYLDYFAANPTWAIVVVFLIAFGEALLIVGLFVPSTLVLVGAGTMVGTGHLEFWPVFLATAIGAILGDQVSYWAGRLFGDRLRTMWPLNRYPALVIKGEDFVRNHGGKSIAIGRFVPGVKAVVPGIVGMLGMNQPFFIFVNVTSGIVWAAAHVLPGVLLGQGLALAGEFSGRLAFLLLCLLVALGALGWVARLIAAGLLSPAVRRMLRALSVFVRSLGSRPFHRLSRSIEPESPRSTRILSLAATSILALLALTYLMFRIFTRDTASNLDQSVNTLLSELRNAPADELMIALTLFGTSVVTGVTCLAMAIWLYWHRAWRAAFGVIAAFAVQQIATNGLKHLVGRERPYALPPEAHEAIFSFPSGHAAQATLVFGMLAIIAGHTLGRWSKALVISMACMAIFLIGFSRVYLGVHWLSDVLGGIALSAVIIAVFGFALEAFPARRTRPLGLIGLAMLAMLAAGAVQNEYGFENAEKAYARPVNVETLAVSDWAGGAWRKVPQRRIDLSGRSGDPLVAQWAGSVEDLERLLKAGGFTIADPWVWQSALIYSDPKAPFDKVPPRPLLHEGLRARLTAVQQDAASADQRLVLRAFKSGIEIRDGAVAKPVFLISLLRERNEPRFRLVTLPRSLSPSRPDVEAVISLLSGPDGPLIVGENSGLPEAIILSAPPAN